MDAMTSKKLHITYMSDCVYVAVRQREYTGAFMSLYKQIEMSKDQDFVVSFKSRWNLNDIEFRSILSEVTAVRASKQTHDEEIAERIADIEQSLKNREINDDHKVFKLKRKLSKLNASIGSESCFGKVGILRKISKECNKPVEERDSKKLAELYAKWKKSRRRGIYVTGEANQKCNRFFELSRINEGIVIYKANKEHKVEIRFNVEQYKNWRHIFEKIAEQSKLRTNHSDCILPVSVRMTESDLILIYDEEILNGFGVDARERRSVVKEIKTQNLHKDIEKKRIKEIYCDFYRQQEQLKLKDKIENRVIAIDMNPNYVGYAVIDMHYNDDIEEYTYKVISTGCFDLSSLNRKRHFKPGSNAYTYIHNKRHYEIDIIAKKLFSIAGHYRCSKFIIEDLFFKTDDKSSACREANRLTKNVWCRKQLTERITRRCNEIGIILEKINAVYSSFIGNIQHKYIDPCNAAIEIARHGSLRYKKGSFYPTLTCKDQSTLGTLFGDGFSMTACQWREIYQSARSLFKKQKDFSHRWRKRIGDVSVGHRYLMCSIDSCKSRVRHIVFH